MRALIAAFILASVMPAAVADYSAPPQHTAEYTIDKGPLTVARATTKFFPLRDSGYLYRLHLRTTGLATLFSGTAIRERSQGKLTNEGYRPRRYVFQRSGDDEAERNALLFDWRSGKARSRGRDASATFDIPSGTLDRLVSPLQLMRDLAVNGESERRMTYHIADDDELKTYQVRVGERQTIRTGAGVFEAVLVIRRNEEGDKRTRLWCAPALDYLPVKIAQREDGEDTLKLQLASVDGLDPNRD